MKTIISIVVGFGLLIIPVSAAEYIVSTSGVDGAGVPGTLASPFRTPQYAWTRMSPNDTMSIRAGTYSGGGRFYQDDASNSDPALLYHPNFRNGTAGNYTTIRGYPGDAKPVLKFTHPGGGAMVGGTRVRRVIYSGLRFDGTGSNCQQSTTWSGGGENILTNCEIANFTAHGVLINLDVTTDSQSNIVTSCLITNWGVGWSSGSAPHGIYNECNNSLFERNILHHGNPASGDRSFGIKMGQGNASGNVVRYNTIWYTCGGIEFADGTNNVCYGNVIHTFGGFSSSSIGISCYNGSESNVIFNNTIFNGYSAMTSQIQQNNNIWQNNLIFHMAEFGAYVGTPHSGGFAGDNHWTNNLITDVGGIVFGSSPNTASGNLTSIRPATSPYQPLLVNPGTSAFWVSYPPDPAASLQDIQPRDFHLQATSSARNTGKPVLVTLPGIAGPTFDGLDPDGQAYGQGGAWDIGAFEYVEGGAIPSVAVVASDPDADENGNTGTYTFSRTGSTAAPLTINFTVSGTGSPGIDWVSFGTSVVIGAGNSSTNLILVPMHNTGSFSNKTATVTLASGGGTYSITSPNPATVTVADIDHIPTAPPNPGGQRNRPKQGQTFVKP